MVTASPLAPKDVAALAAELAQGASPELRAILAESLRAGAASLARHHFTSAGETRARDAVLASVEALAQAVELWSAEDAASTPAAAAAPLAKSDSRPDAAPLALAVERRAIARAKGYAGEPCRCGSFDTRRNGTCLVCASCGETTGCS